MTKSEWKVREKCDCYIIYEANVKCPQQQPPVPQGCEGVNCGGGYPYFVVYDPEKVAIHWFSAKAIERGELDDFLEEMKDKVLVVLDASVHDCWKVKKHQKVVLVRRG